MAGALRSLADGADRRQALWSAGIAAWQTDDRLAMHTGWCADTARHVG
jgi:hypothetical protein